MKTLSRLKWFPFLECMALFALAFVVRVWFLNRADMGNDECFSVYYAQGSLAMIVNTLIYGDNPPLWELLLHFWQKAFGIGEASGRILSSVFSALTVAPIYYIGERKIGRGYGWAAALMFAFCSLSLYLSHEARVYSLIGLAAASSLCFFLMLYDDGSRRKTVLCYIGLTLSNLILLYGHYLSVWTIVVEVLVVLSFRNWRKKLGKGFVAHIIVLIAAFSPMLPVVLRRFQHSGLHGTWVSRVQGIEDFYNMLMHFLNAPVVAVMGILLMVAALVLLIVRRFNGTWRNETGDNFGKILTMFWLFPLAISFLLSIKVGFFLNRYFYFLIPVFFLALMRYAFFLSQKREWIGRVMALAMVVAMAVSFQPDSMKLRFSQRSDSIKQAVRKSCRLADDGVTVVVDPDWLTLRIIYYFDEKHELFKEMGEADKKGLFREDRRLGQFMTVSEYQQNKPEPAVLVTDEGSRLKIEPLP